MTTNGSLERPAGCAVNDPSTTAPPDPRPRLTHADVLKIALPITLSNATVPLIGFVDTAVVGQLGEPHLMGAVAIGAVIFNLLYWTFSFLRMATTGLTAQAVGAGESREVAGHLLRALFIAVLAGLALVVLQQPVGALSFWLTGGSAEVLAAGQVYFDIRIWAAPAGLINFALLGWLIGLGRANVAFCLQLLLNLVNIGLAVLFTLGFGAGVAGVGFAALIAEVVAAGAGLVTALAIARGLGAAAPWADAVDGVKLSRSLSINADITVRSLANYAALILFTSQGASAGDITLAANALLINLKNIVIYLLDGFAFAAEALVGRAIGARDQRNFWRAVELSTIWAGVFAVLVAVILWFAGARIIAFSAKNEAVQAAAVTYLGWAALSPLLGVWCFQLDGIFIGATQTRDMRNMMLASLAVFFLAFWLLAPRFGNHGLWAAYMVFYLTRAATLLWRLPYLVKAAFP